MRVSGSESPNRTNEEKPIHREPGRGDPQGSRWRPEGRRSMPQARHMRDGMKGASPAMSLRSVASRPTTTGRADTVAWASPSSSASGNSKPNTPSSSGCMPILRWRTTRSRNSSKKSSDASRPPRGGRLAHRGTEPSRVAGVPAGESRPHQVVSPVAPPSMNGTPRSSGDSTRLSAGTAAGGSGSASTGCASGTAAGTTSASCVSIVP